MEKAYKFREELLQIHKPDIRDISRKTKEVEKFKVFLLHNKTHAIIAWVNLK